MAFRSHQVCLRQLSVISNQKNFLKVCTMIAIHMALQGEPLSSQEVEPSTNGSRAQPSFFQRKAEGWHWYQSLSDESRSNDKVKKSLPKEATELPSKSLSPTQQIETQRKNLEKKLHAAIIAPTQENLISYITAQKALMDQSQKFSEVWKQVVMTTPSLDETLIHPVDQNARHIYYTQLNQHLEKQIKKLAGEYGLFFFFRKNCAYCHQFAPVVRRFSQKYGWSVLGISLDGGTLPEFPNAKQNNGIAERLQITHVPALIALHPKTGQLIPLAYGMISESEIEQRAELLTRISEEEKK